MAERPPWPGIRNDTALTAEDGMLAMHNVGLRVDGECRRRAGLGARLPAGGILASALQHPVLGTYAIVNAGGSLVGVNVQTAAVATLAASINANIRGSFAKANGRTYFANDFNAMQRIERGDVACLTAGVSAPAQAIGAPTVSGGGACTAGTHALRYRYFQSQSLYPSSCSLPATVTLTGTSTLFLGVGSGQAVVPSTDPKVDQIIIEMTDAGSGNYYQVATVLNTVSGVTISIADTALIELPPATVMDGDNLGGGHNPPPVVPLVCQHRGRLFGWGAVPLALTGVTVTSGSTAIANAVGGFATGWTRRVLLMSGDTTPYTIAAVGAASGATLLLPYAGTSRTAAATVYCVTPDLLYWSRAGYPESWDQINWARHVLQDGGDLPSGMASYYNLLWLFGQHTVATFDYQSDPAAGTLQTAPTVMGVWNQQCLVLAEGRLFGWGRAGAFYLNGLVPQHISRPVDQDVYKGNAAALIAQMDPSQSASFHGIYDPHERVITWFYAGVGDSGCRRAIRYDLDRQRWYTASYDRAISASTLMAGSTNDNQALVCDATYAWYLTDGVFDAVPTTLANSGGATGILTVSGSGATATVIPVAQALPVAPAQDLAGAVVQTTTGATATVLSNTASAITLAAALSPLSGSSVMPNGTELWVGSMPVLVRPKWSVGSGMSAKQRPYLDLQFVPDIGLLQYGLTIYKDFSTNADTFTANPHDTFPMGITLASSGTMVVIPADCGGEANGFAGIMSTSVWERAIGAAITTQRPAGAVRMLAFRFDLLSPAGDVPTYKD